MAIYTDEVIMLPEPVGFLVLGLILSKLVLRHKIARDQEIQRIIDGCTAYLVVI